MDRCKFDSVVLCSETFTEMNIEKIEKLELLIYHIVMMQKNRKTVKKTLEKFNRFESDGVGKKEN